ncbi:glycosyltransferase [Mesorhizobium sp. ZMM04-4]
MDEFDKPGQTFVNRHINSLFQGNTVVISRRPVGSNDPIKPVFVYDKPRLRLKTVLRPMSLISKVWQSAGLEDFLRGNNVEVILAEFGYCGVNLYREAEKFGIPMFCYFRGADASRWLNYPKYVGRLREMIGSVEGIFSVSQFLLDQLASRGIVHSNAVVIPSGVDTELFAPGMKDPNLLCSVGRLIEKKGHLATLEAFRRVASEFPNVCLEIVGDGELLGRCQSFVKTNGLAERVRLHGYRDHEFVRELLSRSSVFLQHSVTDEHGETEGMPTSVQEAMAAGNAIIATAHAGIPEHVTDHVNGFLTPENDVEAYCDRLRTVLASRALLSQLANNARTYAVEILDCRIGLQRLESQLLKALYDRKS